MYRVLIVEDDPMVAMINEQYVRKNKQFSVIGSCRDGKAALEFLEGKVLPGVACLEDKQEEEQ